MTVCLPNNGLVHQPRRINNVDMNISDLQYLHVIQKSLTVSIWLLDNPDWLIISGTDLTYLADIFCNLILRPHWLIISKGLIQLADLIGTVS